MKHLSCLAIILSILLGMSLSACGPEALPGDSGQGNGLSAQAAPTPTAGAIAISPIVLPTEAPTPEIEILATRTAVATPDLTAPTQTELDQMALANPRPLRLPQEMGQVPLGSIAWSPDSKQFLANATGEEVLRVGQAGYAVPDLFLGNGETGEVRFLAHNAGWPAWSRDGQSFYYLAGRVEEDQVRYDLYRADPGLVAPELVAAGIGDTGTQPAVAELADGRLVLLDHTHQVAIWDRGSVTPIADVAGTEALRGKVAGFSVAPDGQSLVVLGQDVPATLIDLATGSVEAVLPDSIHFADNIAWSADSGRLAYGTANGLFVYDRANQAKQVIADRSGFQFPPDDPMAGFQAPVWSPDGRFVLFAATTGDWIRPGRLNTDTVFHFVARVDGTQRKALSDKAIIVAPNPLRAIEFRSDPQTGAESPALVDVVWPSG